MREVNAPNARVDRLVAYLLDGVAPSAGDLEGELGAWLSASGRFLAFADAHRDKIRKKLRVASDPDARGDVLAELETAFLLLADRRIELAFEAYGSGRRGPDFTVTYRASHRYNLEVTRPRARSDGSDRSTALAHAVLGKLRQFPADAPNALLVATGLADSDEDVGVAMRNLKIRADRGDEQFFAGRGLSLSQFQLSYRRLAALLVGSAAAPGVHVWLNPEARRRLPDGAAAACLACLGGADWRAHP
jgi:hypothetical protein